MLPVGYDTLKVAEKGLTGQRKARGAISFQEVFDELIDRRMSD